MMSGLGANQNALIRFQSSMQAMNSLMSNQNLMLLPKDGAMTSINYGFGGLSEVYELTQMDVAGAAEIPVTRLYGRTRSGLSTTNEGDEKIYEERIALDQEDQLLPQLEILYPVLCASTLGEIPDDLDLRCPSIRVLDPKDKADVATAIFTGITGLFIAGIIKKSTALQELKQASDVTEIGTNISDEEIEAAQEEEEALAAMPPEERLMLGEPEGEAGAEEPGASKPKPPREIARPEQSATPEGLRRGMGADEWQESEHPRGQPENAGQFGSGGGSAGRGEKSAPRASGAQQRPSVAGGETLRPRKEAAARELAVGKPFATKLPKDHPDRKRAEGVIARGKEFSERVLKQPEMVEYGDKLWSIKRKEWRLDSEF
jgi:hypothetical protein